jgi:hypothetical protein
MSNDTFDFKNQLSHLTESQVNALAELLKKENYLQLAQIILDITETSLQQQTLDYDYGIKQLLLLQRVALDGIEQHYTLNAA